ncbi:hypothetical protein KM149_09830 [Staphylococcus coagulans]|nr:hypothetical protein KM149_09830 [Staphylococcus coagulans]
MEANSKEEALSKYKEADND